jgi:hypothetical protein
MPRIRCSYLGCVYREGDYCNVELVELDPEEGCLTFTPLEDILIEEEDWDEIYEEEKDLFDEDEEDDDDGYDPSEWN